MRLGEKRGHLEEAFEFWNWDYLKLGLLLDDLQTYLLSFFTLKDNIRVHGIVLAFNWLRERKLEARRESL
jgi:hypothetical protein